MKTFQTKQNATFNGKPNAKKASNTRNPRLAERNEQRAARPTSKPLIAKKSVKPTASFEQNKTTEKKEKVLGEKLQKILARAGQGSRRELEAVIAAGRVSVDGKIASLGDRVVLSSATKIRIDGHLINIIPTQKEICRVLMLSLIHI